MQELPDLAGLDFARNGMVPINLSAPYAADSKRSYTYVDDQLKKIKKLTAFMKKAGLIHLKQDNIELSLVPQAIELPHPEPEIDSNARPAVQYTPEDALFWSAPGFPEEANQ